MSYAGVLTNNMLTHTVSLVNITVQGKKYIGGKVHAQRKHVTTEEQ
jgi:hypothetical protein